MFESNQPIRILTIKKRVDFSKLKSGLAFRSVNGTVLCLFCESSKQLSYSPPKCRAHRFTRIGVISSKKVGVAVVRNRAKRLIREAIRLSQYLDYTCYLDILIIARSKIVGKKMRDVCSDIDSCIKDYMNFSNRKIQLLNTRNEQSCSSGVLPK